jgi:integrase
MVGLFSWAKKKKNMPRAYPHSHVCHNRLVGFNIKRRGSEPTYYVYFRSMDGRRLERDTNQTTMPKAFDSARLIIENEYAPAPTDPEKVTWDQAVERLKARLSTSGHRSSTLGYYLKLIRSIREMYALRETAGPADITPGKAAAWRDKKMALAGRRKKPPSAHYIAGMIAGLSALWQKWFMDDLKIVQGNPWQDVEPPQTDKLPVKFATDDMIEHFYQWIAGRFGEWAFPKLFLSTKAYTGCRLMDLCGLQSDQLRKGRLVLAADQTKGRKERAVPLQNDLFTSLDAFKGGIWLWENYLPGLKAALVARNWPTHQLNMQFSPKRLYFWVETLFADYRTANPERSVLTTHLFRKRAFTMAWQAGIDMRQASIAFGCNLDTLMRHYSAMDEQQVTDDVFARMNAKKR